MTLLVSANSKYMFIWHSVFPQKSSLVVHKISGSQRVSSTGHTGHVLQCLELCEGEWSVTNLG